MAHDDAMDELLEAPGAEHPRRHRPEGAAVVAPDAQAPEEPREDAEPPPDIVRGEPARVHGVWEAMGEGMGLLVRVARVEERGLEGRLDAAPPHVEHGVVRQEG